MLSWTDVKNSLSAWWETPSLVGLFGGSVVSPKAAAITVASAGAVATAGLGAKTAMNMMRARSGGTIGSRIGSSAPYTPDTPAPPPARGGYYPRPKSVKAMVADAAFKEGVRFGKAFLKPRRGRARPSRAQEKIEELVGGEETAAPRRRARKRRSPSARVKRAKRARGRRTTRGATPKQLAARKRFAERYGGRR